MAKVAELVYALALPVVAEQGCTLWDVEYVKEAGSWYLRVYIDKAPGVSIDDCEAVSRTLSDLLDEADPIPESYIFEVSSAGADRVLKTPSHFTAYLGSMVELRLYKPRDGAKRLVGTLSDYQAGDICLLIGADTVLIPKQDIAQVRLHVSF